MMAGLDAPEEKRTGKVEVGRDEQDTPSSMHCLKVAEDDWPAGAVISTQPFRRCSDIRLEAFMERVMGRWGLDLQMALCRGLGGSCSGKSGGRCGKSGGRRLRAGEEGRGVADGAR